MADKSLMRTRLPRALRILIITTLVLVLVYAAGWVLARTGAMVSSVLIPFVVGILLAALLMPILVFFNHKLRFQRHLASAVTVVGLIAVVSATMYIAGRSIGRGFGELRDSIGRMIEQFEQWLVDSPLGIDQSGLQDLLARAREWLTDNTTMLTSGVFSSATSAGNLLVGAVLALIVAFFVLAEGDRICSFLLMVFNQPTRTRVRETIRRSWVTLGSWARTQVIVSAVDAVFIGIGAAILGLPLVLPMVVLTFLLCFIPLFGAILSGAMFTLVALLFSGPLAAVIMLLIVIGVQQVESNVLHPLLMGRAVSLHPLVVLLGVTTSTFLLGLTGALLAVPLMASVNAGYKYWVGRDPFPGLDAGGSALTGNPRALVPAYGPSNLPKRMGDVTPEWIERERSLTVHSEPLVEVDEKAQSKKRSG